MKKIILSLIVSLMIVIQVSAEEIEHFCHDPLAEAEWHALIQKYPYDLNVQTLHALRIGLCEKIDRGDLTVPDAIAIFEAMRSVAVNRAFQKRLQGDGKESEL
jgi:hypothetical protein